MKPLLVAGAIVGLALCVLVLCKGQGEGRESALERVVDGAVVPEAASVLPAPDERAIAPQRAAPTASKPARAAPESARIRGTFLSPDGAPASGVAIELRGWRTEPAPAEALTPMLQYLFTSGGPRKPPAARFVLDNQIGCLRANRTTGDFRGLA